MVELAVDELSQHLDLSIGHHRTQLRFNFIKLFSVSPKLQSNKLDRLSLKNIFSQI